jgi:thioredoxin-related protein
MKIKHILLSCLLFAAITISPSCTSTSDQGMKWTTFEKISAKQGQKMVFIELYTSWCGWCRRMENVTFNDPNVAKYMNKNFYNIRFDAEDRRAVSFLGKNYKFNSADGTRGRHGLAKALMQDSEKQGYPTIAFLDENYNLIQAIPGYIIAKDFEVIMHYFGDKSYKTQTWAEFVKKYNVQGQVSDF